jgi:DNA-binding PadR family transcriptional regulator
MSFDDTSDRGRRQWRRDFRQQFRGDFGDRGPRMRRGDIRTALLAVLAEGPGHGYDVMQKLEEKSGGAWRPSPGSVYPTLQLLEDEGLVRSAERDGKRVFEITDAGRAEAERRIAEAGGTPWEVAGKDVGRAVGVRDAMGGLLLAFKQINAVGTPAQVEQALDIMAEARRKMYLLLAEQ